MMNQRGQTRGTGPGLLAWRYVAGQPLCTRPGTFPYLNHGDGRWAGWQRQMFRLTLPAGLVVAYQLASAHRGVALAGAVGAVAWMRRRWADRKFRRIYIRPTERAVRVAAGMIDVDLRIDRKLGSLVERLVKPVSPAEAWLRDRYGRWLEPGWRWPADRIMRARWAVTRRVAPHARTVAAWFTRPGKQTGPAIRLQVDGDYLSDDQRKMISSIINAKIPVGDLVERWDQVGPVVRASWTPRQRPPLHVGLGALQDAWSGLAEWEYFLGLGAGSKPVTISLRDDSPHIAVSAGSGGGKSVLAALVGVQVLARGGNVILLDRKGSHRWALGLAGVDYCTRPDQMHDALIKAGKLADLRNSAALYEAEDWDPGPRTLIIAEELNATIGQLAAYWADVREKGDPKRSPAINAFNDISFMGRSAKVNTIAIAQMLSAKAVGGPESRENYGIRCLARYTTNNWKMLVPEARMPHPSRTLGRWQVVVGGQATETQVTFLTVSEARAFASVADVPDGALTRDVPVGLGHLTLVEAIDAGVLTGSYEACRKRIQRDPGAPQPVGRKGSAALYRRADLVAWAAPGGTR